MALAPGAALLVLVLLLGFIMVALSVVVVLETIKLLLFRSVAVGPMLVAKLVIVGVKKQNLPLPPPWGLLRWRRGGVVHDIQHPIPGTLASPSERLLIL